MLQTIDTVLLDLDDTLYQIPQIPKLMLERIQNYMTNKLGIPTDKVPEMSAHFYMNFGTTLAGLVANGYTIDFDDWHAHVHGTLPYQQLVHRDDKLRQLLQQIKVPLYVFTNADDRHADVCLRLMGIADLFKGIITFESIQAAATAAGKSHNGVPVVCKPTRLAYELALRSAGNAMASSTAFFDDSARNVTSSASMGIYSVLVGRKGANSGADAEVLSLHDLPSEAPELWAQLTRTAQQPLPSLRTLQPPAQPHQQPQVASSAADAMPLLMRRLSVEGSSFSSSFSPSQRDRRYLDIMADGEDKQDKEGRRGRAAQVAVPS